MIKILGCFISMSEIDFNSSKLYTDPDGFVGLFSIRHLVDSLILHILHHLQFYPIKYSLLLQRIPFQV